MSRFSETLMDHFQDPRHLGRMEQPDAVGIGGVPGQGPHVAVYLRIDHGRVVEARFECQGCGVTIACGSVVTELVTGRSIADCSRVTAIDIIQALDGIPLDKQDRASLAIRALQDALARIQHEEYCRPA